MAKQTLLENDIFRITDDGDRYTIYQKRTDDEGTNFLHRVWQSVGYDAVAGNQGQEFELLLLLLLSHIKANAQQTAPSDDATVLDLVQPS